MLNFRMLSSIMHEFPVTECRWGEPRLLTKAYKYKHMCTMSSAQLVYYKHVDHFRVASTKTSAQFGMWSCCIRFCWCMYMCICTYMCASVEKVSAESVVCKQPFLAMGFLLPWQDALPVIIYVVSIHMYHTTLPCTCMCTCTFMSHHLVTCNVLAHSST